MPAVGKDEDDPKSGFDEPKVFADPNEKSPGVGVVVVDDDAGVEPKLKGVVPGLKLNDAGAGSDVVDDVPNVAVKGATEEVPSVGLVVVELEGLELADEKLKVDVGAADERLKLPEPKDIPSLDEVLLILLPPLPKLKLTFGPSDGVVTGKDGLESAASPALKLTNVDVVRLDGVSDFLALPAFLAFLCASSFSWCFS